jgi:hypothetical protein
LLRSCRPGLATLGSVDLSKSNLHGPLRHENGDRIAVGDAHDLAGEGFGLSGQREEEEERN